MIYSGPMIKRTLFLNYIWLASFLCIKFRINHWPPPSQPLWWPALLHICFYECCDALLNVLNLTSASDDYKDGASTKDLIPRPFLVSLQMRTGKLAISRNFANHTPWANWILYLQWNLQFCSISRNCDQDELNRQTRSLQGQNQFGLESLIVKRKHFEEEVLRF